jgi:Ser/Thr protein kinase RdoA (MazF antagonist)
MWGWDTYSVQPWGDSWQMGYNSRTWLLRHDAGLHVLKAVPHEQRAAFTSGLRAALIVDARGVPSGAPRLTLDGEVAGEDSGWCWALLDYVEGAPADPASPDQLARVGETLGLIHTGLRDLPALPGVMTWGHLDWLLAEEPFLDGHPWVQRAIREALEALPRDLTVGMIHCGARVGEFRIGRDAVGLVDWGDVMYAPHIYDLATTISFLPADTDPMPFLRGYLTESIIAADELRYIPSALKLRAGIEAWVYARRLRFGISIGQKGAHINSTLMERARKNIAAAEAKDEASFLP